MKKDEDRVVLRRGMIEHDWRKSRRAPHPIEAAHPPSPRPTRAGLSRWMPLIVAGTLAAAAIGLLLALSFRSFDAQGSSMEPELSAGDSLIVARVAYEEVDFGLLNWLPLYDSPDLRWVSP